MASFYKSENLDTTLETFNLKGKKGKKEMLLNDIQKEYEESPFSSLVGLKVLVFKEGKVTLEIPVQKHFYNTMGTVHGGIYATLLDTAMAMTTKSVVKVSSVTINMNINFIKAISEGILIVEGTIIKLGYRLVLTESKIFDENGVLLANATGTFKVLREKENK
jgi:uncharacterized protein (TIGR00369 family)